MKYFTGILNKKAGLPPGTIIYHGDLEQPTTIMFYQYNEIEFNEKKIESISEILISEKPHQVLQRFYPGCIYKAHCPTP